MNIFTMEKGGCIYILTNKNNSTLYVGVTSDLYSRVIEHKNKIYPNSFSSKYNLNKLVYYEIHHSIEDAILREKQIKAGPRKRKMELINKLNPSWADLFDKISEW